MCSSDLHVSNRYLDLKPVVEGAAHSLGRATRIVESPNDDDNGIFRATWVLASDSREFFEPRELHMAASLPGTVRKPQLWTDDYSNLFHSLK